MTARQAYAQAKEIPEFKKAEEELVGDCGEYDGGCFLYMVGDEVFSRSYCKCDGFRNHKMKADKSIRCLFRTGCRKEVNA